MNSPIGEQTWQRCYIKFHTEKRFAGQHAQKNVHNTDQFLELRG